MTLFDAAAHHVLVAASSGSAVTELPGESFRRHLLPELHQLRRVAWLNAKHAVVLVQPHFAAAVLKKREDSDGSKHGVRQQDRADMRLFRRAGVPCLRQGEIGNAKRHGEDLATLLGNVAQQAIGKATRFARQDLDSERGKIVPAINLFYGTSS